MRAKYTQYVNSKQRSNQKVFSLLSTLATNRYSDVCLMTVSQMWRWSMLKQRIFLVFKHHSYSKTNFCVWKRKELKEFKTWFIFLHVRLLECLTWIFLPLFILCVILFIFYKHRIFRTKYNFFLFNPQKQHRINIVKLPIFFSCQVFNIQNISDLHKKRNWKQMHCCLKMWKSVSNKISHRFLTL